MPTENSIVAESSISSISPNRLVQAVACPAFQKRYRPEDLRVTSPFDHALTETGAFAQVQEGVLPDATGIPHPVRWTRDRNAILLQIFSPDGSTELVHLGIRDRKDDGTPASTPPKYLREIGGLTDGEIPPESMTAGATNWYYASPYYDNPPAGTRPAEFSIGSADESTLIVSQLRNGNKPDKLFDRSPERLARFIEDPFALIPPPGSSGEEINAWYRFWWQVVNRGLRGKRIPYPGQSSQHGFEGFFDHVVDSSVQILRELGYTHLSGVPSYHHVWDLNLEHGFQPENKEMHDQAVAFDRVLKNIPIPDFAQPYQCGALSLRDTLKKPSAQDRTRNPLLSWYALLPYVLLSHPRHHPVLNINHGVEEQFQDAFSKAISSLSSSSGIMSYPLAPGANLWHSKSLI